jgi:hemolysin activation/secretion protein
LLGRSALLATAIPARPGDLLNLRDIEQGLREPQARAHRRSRHPDRTLDRRSGAKPGDSDLVVKYVQSKKWRRAP